MDWFNYYGLALMALIMIPNIVYAVKHKNTDSAYGNKAVIVLEQIGRYGCMAFMVFNIPYTYLNFWFDYALIAYLCGNGALYLAYLIFWVICRNRNDRLRAISLSVIPSVIFLFSAIILVSILLLVFAVIFSVTHILISVKSVV